MSAVPDTSQHGQFPLATAAPRIRRSRTSPAAPSVFKVAEDGQPAQPPSEGDAHQTNRRVGIVLSLILHGVILAVLALQVLPRENGTDDSVNTLVQTGFGSGGGVGDPLSIDMGSLLPAAGKKTNEALEIASVTSSLVGEGFDLPNAGAGGGGGAGLGGGGHGGGAGNGGDGFLNLPGNAVMAGSFAAWTTPQGLDNLRRRFKPPGEPGDSPEPGELYYITIQMKMPEGESVYSLSDLDGEVVGTDKYRQRIPQGMYVHNEDGELVRPPRSGKLKVKEGVIELIMIVPGAARLVEDTIQIHSKLLKESQTLTLRFEG